MAKYCALTVRKLKPGSYDEWRAAWWPESESDENMPDNAEVYIVRNLKDPDEIIAFGIVEGDMQEIQAGMDLAKEQERKEAMAPYIESTGADGIYEVMEHIDMKSRANA
ncbi:MAG: hypothetical protein ABI896_02930 [Actinomycetota bacterium]